MMYTDVKQFLYPPNKKGNPMLNKVLLSGVLTKTVELRQTSANDTVATLVVLIRDGAVKPDGSHYESRIKATVWGKEASKCEGLAEGSAVSIEGALRNRKDGENWVLEVNAFKVTPF